MGPEAGGRIYRELELAGLPTLDRSAWVEVDLDALSANARALDALASPAALGVVVKADGYGHGLEMAARCAVAGGATWLCVADSSEAERLRSDGHQGKIFVLYPVPPTRAKAMADLGVDVTAGSRDDVQALALGLPGGAPNLSVHLEIDTGMGRGGSAPADALAVASEIATADSLDLAGVWTHLAAPEDRSVTAAQMSRFESALDALADAGIEPGVVHAAASGGMLATSREFQTLVRPGLAFYGVHPGAGEPLPPSVHPALSVKAQPVRVARVPAGSNVGYGGTWTAARESQIATLPIGYADGWSRSSSPGTFAVVDGVLCPLVGRVSSDSVVVDVTGVQTVTLETEFVLLGENGATKISADEIAAARGTISWEVLQQLGARLSRVYRSDRKIVALRPESTTEIVVAPGATIPGYGQATR